MSTFQLSYFFISNYIILCKKWSIPHHSQKIFVSLQSVKENNRGYEMEEQTFMDLIYQSMQDSAREARLSLGRPS
jgi:hypothetical protein